MINTYPNLARRPSPPCYAGGEGLANVAAYCVSREFPFPYYSLPPKCTYTCMCMWLAPQVPPRYIHPRVNRYLKTTQHLAVTCTHDHDSHEYYWSESLKWNVIGQWKHNQVQSLLDPLRSVASPHARTTRRGSQQSKLHLPISIAILNENAIELITPTCRLFHMAGDQLHSRLLSWLLPLNIDHVDYHSHNLL